MPRQTKPRSALPRAQQQIDLFATETRTTIGSVPLAVVSKPLWQRRSRADASARHSGWRWHATCQGRQLRSVGRQATRPHMTGANPAIVSAAPAAARRQDGATKHRPPAPIIRREKALSGALK
jgi:hypothetical protein